MIRPTRFRSNGICQLLITAAVVGTVACSQAPEDEPPVQQEDEQLTDSAQQAHIEDEDGNTIELDELRPSIGE